MNPALAALGVVTAAFGVGEGLLLSATTGTGTIRWGNDTLVLHPLATELLGGLIREEILDRTDLRVELVDLAHEIIAFGTLPGFRGLQPGSIEDVFLLLGNGTATPVFGLPGKETHSLEGIVGTKSVMTRGARDSTESERKDRITSEEVDADHGDDGEPDEGE